MRNEANKNETTKVLCGKNDENRVKNPEIFNFETKALAYQHPVKLTNPVNFTKLIERKIFIVHFFPSESTTDINTSEYFKLPQV